MTKDRPLIGINMDLTAPNRGRAPRSHVQSGYYDCILTAGAIPVLIPPLTKEADLLPILERLDGLVLSEGDDMDPRKMGLGAHPAIKVMQERRELCDRILCKIAFERRMPLLGIGLGLHEMVVCYGGGIFQHLPEDLPRCIPHRDPHGEEHRHVVVMDKGSMLEDIYGEGEVCVNSYHHQGVRKLPNGFRAAATAPDGLIEAIEWKEEDWFAVGVQWHPQNEGHISLDMQLLEAFVNAAAKWTGARVAAPALSLAKAG